MMRRGWRGESYRHYLASKGIASGRRGVYLAAKGVRTVPAYYAVRPTDIGDAERQRMLAQRQMALENVAHKKVTYVRHLKALDVAWHQAVDDGNIAESERLNQKMLGVRGILDRLSATEDNLLNESYDDRPSKEEEEGSPPEGFFAKKSFLQKNTWEFSVDDSKNEMDWLETSSDERLDDYVHRNVVRTQHGGWPVFKASVVQELQHPWKDLDGDWKRYNLVAGRKERLSSDGVQRAEQRGAALTARVITQANVEPLIDHGKHSTARSLAGDVMFGRTDAEVKKC